tara:strand:- start:214 stop:660 length:447 start_codon:yes stop_codon:yes gene_type:complete
MAQQVKVRSTTTIAWADAVNNDANWTNAWTITEYAKIAVSDLDLAYSAGPTSIKIEEVLFTGTGTTPATASKSDTQLLIAKDAAFTDVVCIELGLQSDAKYDTNNCIAAFSPGHYITVDESDELYFTVKCGGSGALLADAGRLTVSQN